MNYWNLLWIVPTVVSAVAATASVLVYFGEVKLVHERRKSLEMVAELDPRIIGPARKLTPLAMEILDEMPVGTQYDTGTQIFILPSGQEIPKEVAIHLRSWTRDQRILEACAG